MTERKRAPGPCADCNGVKYVGDGVRCEACQVKRAKKAAASQRAKDRRVERVYGITPEEYAAILGIQGGRCAICLRKPGKKRLSVDHDHAREGEGVRQSVRGLLCRNCNYVVLGYLGDSTEALQRAITYLEMPPAREVLGYEA